MHEVFLGMKLRGYSNVKCSADALINAIRPPLEARAFVVTPIFDPLRYLRDVDQPIILMQAICGETEDQIPRLSSSPDHWLTNRQGKETPLGTRRTTVIDG